MTAGLPGVGLSGLFILASALVMPFVELFRRMSNQRSPRIPWPLWRLSVMLVAVTVVIWELVGMAIRWAGSSDDESFPSILISLSVMFVIMGTAFLLSKGEQSLVPDLAELEDVAELIQEDREHRDAVASSY